MIRGQNWTPLSSHYPIHGEWNLFILTFHLLVGMMRSNANSNEQVLETIAENIELTL